MIELKVTNKEFYLLLAALDMAAESLPNDGFDDLFENLDRQKNDLYIQN